MSQTGVGLAQSVLPAQARQVSLVGSQIGVGLPQLASVRQPTQLLRGTSQTGVAAGHPVALVAEQIAQIPAASHAGVERYFFASSACAYNTKLQEDPHCRALKESDAYPAYAERGYGWEKLMSEIFCQEYTAERGLKTGIARFHNVYGPWGTWDGGREKAPAAICRKVIDAKAKGDHDIEIWGDGEQTRSFMYIDDCLAGIDKIVHCEELNATPINLGSSEMISINELVTIVEEIGGVKLNRRYNLEAPKGVAGRSSDNGMIQSVLNWEPSIRVRDGLRKTYQWIEEQYYDRRAGRRTVKDVAVGEPG